MSQIELVIYCSCSLLLLLVLSPPSINSELIQQQAIDQDSSRQFQQQVQQQQLASELLAQEPTSLPGSSPIITNKQQASNNMTTSRGSHQNSWLDRNVSESRSFQSLMVASGDQFVAGGASSLLPSASSSTQRPPRFSMDQSTTPSNQRPGRLVDRIAQPAVSNAIEEPASGNHGKAKLDIIIEFMRQNKLSKFCDLMTNQAQNNVHIQQVLRQLNSMNQFTLFVPTNEALLLQPGHFFEQLSSRPEEAARFLLTHATGELVVPKPNNMNRDSGQSLVFSLAHTPLRISTLNGNPKRTQSAPMFGNRLELIVNGANVIPGHSYALQDSNNPNATHAIVHLIDRSLYPAPSDNLLALVRQYAPTMANLIELASSSSGDTFRRLFREPLESAGSLRTLMAPNDEAFAATPAKLMDQLHTNRTFLQQFLAGHLLDGLHFNGQLANLNQQQTPSKQHLNSVGGEQLNFEAKSLQNRQLVVVNSVPIVFSDLMATNGVLHLLSRPLFPANLIDDCNCGQNQTRINTPALVEQPVGIIMSGRGSPVARDSLEREASSVVTDSRQMLRAQRSNGRLLDRNKDFYRPSLAPANLKLAQQPPAALDAEIGSSPIGAPPSGPLSLGAGQQHQEGVAQITPQQNQLASEASVLLAEAKSNQANSKLQQQQELPQLQPLNVVPKYGVTLNATSRLRMRAEQQRAPANNQFAYDQPLANQNQNSGQNQNNNAADRIERLKRPYLAGVVELVPIESGASMRLESEQQLSKSSQRDFLNRGESAKREQRLLRFQPEDGRDSMSKSQQHHNFTSSKQQPGEIIALAPSAQLQPAYDYVGTTPNSKVVAQSPATPASQNAHLQSALYQKLHASAGGPLSCAFYDADCRRLMMSRLVRLPPNTGNRLSKSAAEIGQIKQQQPNLQNVTAAYDTTFGESTSSTPINHQHDQNRHNYTSINANINKSLLSMSGLKQATLPSSTTASPNELNINNNPPTSYSQGSLVSPARLSVLNQPLPPLDVDDPSLKQFTSGHHWRAHETEINRIPAAGAHVAGGTKNDQVRIATSSHASGRLLDANPNMYHHGHGFTSGISRLPANSTSLPVSPVFELPRTSPNSPLRQAQILFVPVKLVNNNTADQPSHHHRASPSFGMNISSSGDSLAMPLPENVLVLHNNNNNSHHSNHLNHRPAPFEASTTQSSLAANARLQQQPAQYLTPLHANHQMASNSPLLGSSSTGSHSLAQHLNPNQYDPMQHHHHHSQRHPASSRSNLTLADDSSEFGFDAPMGADLNNNNNNTQTIAINNANKQVGGIRQLSLPPTPANVAHRNKQNGMLYFGGASSSGGSSNAGGVKWPNQQQQILADFSVTSARLTDNNNNNVPSFLHNNRLHNSTTMTTPGLLAVQASDQRQQTSSSPATSQTSADYFQDRTIAEIMDDSGLRIDGQLVTFKRLKQCLSDANLLSLASQTGNSLTIFMPTDQAFQRLVQVAFGQRQQAQQASQTANPFHSARFQASGSQPQLPLVVRAPPSTITTSSDDVTTLSTDPMMSSLSAIDRLTLDCQAPIVRQMLLDHLSARLITPKQLAQDTSIASLSGRQLILSSVPSKQIVVVDGQPVLAATRAKNGMVYVINKFLNLTQQMPNVVDLIEAQPELSTFVSYMRMNSNSMSDRLKRETGPLTILAPTNDAFDQLSPGARQLINSDPSALMDILRGHVLEGAQFGKLISMRARLNTMNRDQKIEAKVIKPNVYMLDNQMTSMRLVGTAGNGVVNAIDRLIVPAWLRNSMSPAAGGATSARQAPTTAASLDTSASANSGAATLARQLARPPADFLLTPASQPTREALVAGDNHKPRINIVQVQPELVHGNADNIFRNQQNQFQRQQLEAGSFSNHNHQLGRLNGENFLHFSNQNKQQPATNSSASSSSSLGGGGDSLEGFSGGSNELGSSSTNGSSVASALSSKNMLLIEKLANLMQAKKFLKFLLNSRVHELLKPDMNYVILVPTDQAIERLPGQILSLLERDSERLSDLINYHIIDTTFEYINTIPDGQTLQTLNEKDILFNWHRNNSILTVSGAIVLGGIQEENIALLIVDRVLYPTPGDLLAIVNKSPILSNFTTIVRNAGLDSQLSRAGPFTLFAPSDSAFNQLDKADLDYLQTNKEIARRFLLRHLSSPMVFTSSIALSSNITTTGRLHQHHQVPSYNITNSLGEDLVLRQRNDYFSVNDINFSYADVAASNGVLHVIDGLL